ncbi:MAG: DUF1751 domain-containing protein [Spirochaetae bacterium HGW-Spirochaetae-1]|jgi:membrane associated rhomboid family serine protease|nr:MAG: DUF1751 domain-containing protein [Spirochaetae bacterium HGW-Spirochaetae-1]
MNGNKSNFDSWVMRLIMINTGIFFLQSFLGPNEGGAMVYYLGLVPSLVVDKGYVWQIFTYMFLHGGFFHLFLNMYALLIFGIPIEQNWGSKKFLGYFLFTGLGAGITIFLINYFLFGGMIAGIPTIGASGAVFGLLLAFGMLYPDAQILLFFILPIKAKYLVVLYGLFEFYSMVSSGGGSEVSHVGHLGGLVFGLIYFFVRGRERHTLRGKSFRTKIMREIRKRDTAIQARVENRDNSLTDILKKIKQHGIETLSDDEFQQIRYIMIMNDGAENLCVETDFNIDDPYCQKCNNINACIVRELKKYIH